MYISASEDGKRNVMVCTAKQTASRMLPVKNMVKAVGTLKVSRKASDKAYHLLVKFINAYALIEGDSQYLNFIYYVNTVIVHYLREAIDQ